MFGALPTAVTDAIGDFVDDLTTFMTGTYLPAIVTISVLGASISLGRRLFKKLTSSV